MFTKKTRVISMIATVCMVISMLACICVPAYAELDEIPSVQTVTAAPAADGEYKIASLEDWLWLDGDKESWFRSANITIHLAADIDLAGKTFNGFHNLKAKFDGHNHTVSNWGTSATPAASNGMFDAITNANGMVEIKNLKVSNCHITHTGAETASGTALIYGVSNSNGGMTGLPTNVLIENIEVSDSSVANDAENTAIIISRYASTGADATVTLRNIKITGTKLTTSNNHSGLLVGKPRGGNGGSDDATYNIQNVILENNQVIQTKADKTVGLVFGTCENATAGSSSVVNIKNLYANNNSITSMSHAYILGYVDSSATASILTVDGAKITNTTINKPEGKRQFMALGGNSAMTFANVFCDATVEIGSADGVTAALSTTKDAAAAYAFNKDAGTDSILYWTIDAGELVRVGKEAAMRKVEMELTNGDPAGTLYAAAGSVVALSYEGDANATFSTENAAASINGNQLTMPTDGSDVKVIVTLGGDGELNQAKADLQDAIDYFEVDRDVNVFVAELAEALTAAKEALTSAVVGDVVAAKAALMAYADQYKNTLDTYPSVTDAELYAGIAGLMIEDTDDLLWLEQNEALLSDAQTVYLAADLDMTGVNFGGFDSTACFKFNGLNHTIENWTCVKTPTGAGDVSMTARVGFFVSSNVSSIKNVVFDNAQLTGGRESAIVYSTIKSDAVSNKRLEIQNVHVKNSTLNAKGQHSSIIMCNLQDARKAGTGITFCSVIDTKLDFTDKYAGTGNNASAFLGRIEGSGFTGVVQVQNCYANGFEIINGGENCSVISGPTNLTAAEGASIQTKFYNVAAINCKIEGTTRIGVICARNAGIASFFRDVLVYNCELTATASDGYAALAWGNQDWFGNDGTYRTRLYFDDTWNQSTWFVNTNAGSTNVLEEVIADPIYFNAETDLGEVAYKLNERSTVDGWQNFFSINEDGDIEPTWANGRYYIDANGNMVVGGKDAAFATDKAAALRKYTLVNAGTGAELAIGYANGGAEVELNVEGATAYALAEDASATALIDGNILTMPNDYTDVTIKVTLDESAALESALLALEDMIDYFADHPAEKEAALAEALTEAEELIADSTATVADAEACLNTLVAFQNKAPYLPRVTEVDAYPEATGYMLFDKTDFEYVSSNAAKFNTAITLYMGADIDMSGSGFQRINNVKCDFDGMNHTITNYNPTNNAGIFYSYKGTSIKNLTIKNSTATGGYSRAILVSEAQNPGELVIDNVDMENVTLEAAAGGNQMGLYISRTSANGGKITIKNCEVTNCKLTNDSAGATANVNNSGLIIGCIKENHEFLAENIVIKNSSSLVDTKAGGLVFGSFETTSPVTIKNVAVIGGELEVAEGVTHAGVMVGIHKACCPPTFENCFAYDVAVADGVSATWARGWEGQGSTADVVSCDIMALNCAADFDGDYVVISNSEGITTAVGAAFVPTKIMGIAIVDDLNGAVWNANGGEAIWAVNAAATDVVLGTAEGYGVPHQITFTSGVGENASQVGTCYTGIDGKLPASIEWLVNDAIYTWEMAGAPVTMDTVFADDAEVISSVVHVFEGDVVANGDGTHKIYCDDSCGGCDLFITEDCAHKEYTQNADNTHSSKCECGYIIATEACEIEYTFDGIDSHTGLCETCGRAVAKEACNMSEFAILEGDEPTTTAPGKETSSSDKCDHKEYKELNQLAAATLVAVGGESVVIGDTYQMELKLDGNTEPGVSGMVITVEYDADKLALDFADLNPTSGFTGEIDDSEEGKIVIGLMAAEPVTDAAILAAFDFIATEDADLAGATAIDVAVSDVVLSGTAMDDAEVIDLDMDAEGLTVNIVDFTLGDVNMDGNITIADAVLVLRVLNGNLNVSNIDALAADVDGEDGITTADAVQILKYVMGEISTFA